MQTGCTGCISSPPGLYGVDILAIDGNPTSNYNASAWTYRPYIIANPTADNYKLIFNVKDSYQEIYNGTNVSTNVFKQVELNGTPIWREDIAFGGNGWERVEIDFSALDLQSNPIFQSLLTNGNTNVITFSIIMNGSVNTGDVRGLLVWIDDVYLKKFNSADNLIYDGGVEYCTSSGLGIIPDDDCIWYQPTGSAVSFPACTSLARVANTNPVEDFYPDDSPMFFIAANPATQASRTKVEHKSGSYSLVLKLPALDPTTCIDYNPTAQNNFKVISAAVNFDYSDLLSCADYQIAPFLFTQLPTSGTHFNGKFYLDQNITLTGDLVLNACEIVINSSSGPFNPYSITVPNFKTLTITEDGNGNYSSLFACDKMWAGIVVDEGGTLIAGPGTQISDAVIAIVCDANGNSVNAIQIRGSGTKPVIFDENYTAIDLRNGTFLYNAGLGNFISSSNFFCSSGYIQKDPYIGSIPLNHILLNNITSLKIGEGSATVRNIFSNSVFGIYSVNSDFEAIKNRFENMKDGQFHCWGCGTGIFLENSGINSNNVTIGSSNFNNRNFFENLNFGIQQSGKISSTISNNEFLNVKNTGIAVRWNEENLMTIDNNQFINVNTGVFLANLSKCPVNILTNNFNNTTYIREQNTDFYNTAITIQNRIGIKQGLIDINRNTITNNRIGIHARYVDGISIGATATQIGNIITFNQNVFDNFHHGIWLESCKSAKVQANAIFKTSPVTPNSGFSVEGITINECIRSLFNLNNITELNTPVHVISTCTGTEFHCNTITNINSNGDGVKLNAAVLPDQGFDDPSNVDDQTWDNKWYGYTGNNRGVTGSVNQPFNWFYNPSLPAHFPNPQPLLIFAVSLTPTNSDPCVVQSVRSDEERDSRYGYIVGDSAEYIDLISEFGYKEKQNLFSELKKDSSLLSIGSPNDGAFLQFYNDLKGSNIGLLENIDSLISTGNTVGAATLNSFLSDSNLFEYNRKLVNEIFISKVIQDSSLNYPDSIILENVAYQNPVTGGNAVFSARSILGLEIHDSPIQLRKSNDVILPVTSLQPDLYVYPNPANESCLIKFSDENSERKIEIRDALYKIVFSDSAKLSEFSINTSFLNPGMYSVFVFDRNSTQKQIKLVIIH